MKVVVFIFSSGKGTRLQPHTLQIPKPLLPVCDDGSCMLSKTLDVVIKNGLHDVIINYSYGGLLFSKLIKTYENKISCNLIDDRNVLGQGGILLKVRHLLKEYDRILCLNGDTFVDTDYADISERASDNHSVFLSNLHEEKIKPYLLLDTLGRLIGYQSPTRGDYYFYPGVAPSDLKDTQNYLGVLVTPVKPLLDVSYDNTFLGFFGRDDLFERLYLKGSYITSYTDSHIKEFMSMDTCEDYERILKENGCTKPVLHV